MSGPRSNPRAVVDLLGLSACLALLGDLALFAVLPTRTELLGLSLANLGLALSIHRMLRIPGNPLVGLLLDRMGRRRPFQVGMGLAVLSTAGYALAHSLPLFLFFRLLWGTAWMLINVSALSILVDISSSENRGSLAGRYTAWYMAGLTAGPVLGGFLVDWLGFPTGMGILAGFTLAGFALALARLRETGRAAVSTRTAWLRGMGPGDREGLQRVGRQVWPLFLLYAALQFTGEGVTLSTLGYRLKEVLGGSPAFAQALPWLAAAGGFLLGLRSLLAAAAGPLFGGLSDTGAGRARTLAAGTLLGVAGFSVLALWKTIPGLLIGLVLSAVSAGSVTAVLAAWLGDLVAGTQRGFLMGLFSTAGDFGSMLGPLLAYALVARAGLGAVYLLSAALLAFALLATLAARPRLAGSEPPGSLKAERG